jgi:hypothetical protein
MKLTKQTLFRVDGLISALSMVLGLIVVGSASMAHAQAISTTTVQGTVYLASGQPGTGTLMLSWPSFTTANGQLVAADSTTVAIAPDGFVSVNLAPNLGSTPAGLYYTAIYYLSDGTTSTQYWVVPAAAQATLGQVQSQLMPSVQAVQTVSKSYVDQEISQLTQSLLTASGGTLSGPLYLNGDPTQPLQAADKHYVDASVALGVPITGGTLSGPLTSIKLGAVYQVDQFPGADFGAQLSACVSGLSATYGGTCDARNYAGTLSMGSNLTISTANATILLPCSTISTSNQLIVTVGTRNVSLRGCSLRGASTASGSQGGTVFLYSGVSAMIQVGDPTYAANTMGFHLDNVVINTTAATSSTAQAIVAYRTQELDLESLYLLGNSNQTGITLDGTGNYTGGTFYDNQISGFQTAINAIGHQVSNPATTDWLNASTFVRLHIDCPTSGGNPISGTYGINLQQGDGNTFTGGDVEGCSTALHLGSNAQNNTIVGLRNENSTNQVMADAGSSYNSWMTGGTMFTGALTDNGTRNSFLDTFHRSFNGLNGDWYGSQKDATVTNHYRLGTGVGNERGLQDRYQTDYGYRWTMGLSDATAGEQFYQILDELNNVNRISIGQYNNGQSSTNNQTVINSAGTGAVVLNGSNGSGTGGVIFGSGGASETTVATIGNTGNAQLTGTLMVGGTSQSTGTMTVRNNADAEVDYYLWPGLTTSQKGSYTYKDWNGNSQWFMVKDASNNWALNSATGGLDSIKAYQSSNSGDTYVDASNTSGVVRINYETGSGTGFNIYGGNSSSLYASFTGTAAIKFPGLAATSGHNCLQIDNSGYITNTGVACGTGSSSGTVNAGTNGQLAFYNGSGTVISGESTVAVVQGGTGASTASGALSNLGGAPLAGATFTGPVNIPTTFSTANNTSIGPRFDVTNSAFGAVGNGTTDDTAAIQAAFNACYNGGVAPYGGVIEFPGDHSYVISSTINAYDSCQLEGVVGSSSTSDGSPRIIWNGSATDVVSTITGFSITSNIATFTAANSLTAGQWVEIGGLTNGYYLNRVIGQVLAAGLSSTQFEMTIPWSNVSTTADAGTATARNVMIAFDSVARYDESISNLTLSPLGSSTYDVGFYFGSRVDTGTHVLNDDVSGANEYGYYFAGGGINVDFDKGWRTDGVGVAGIYWRVSGVDSFGVANGTVDNNRNGSSTSGVAVMLDNSACVANLGVHFTSRNFKVEVNTSLAPGLGAITLLDCPSNSNGIQFYLDLENTWVSPYTQTTAGVNISPFAVSPANDEAVSLNIVNGEFPSGTGANTSARWSGMPQLSRNDALGSNGIVPMLSYAPANKSAGSTSLSYGASATLSQFIGDTNINQLYQYGVPASTFLYSDTAFAALPIGTTLYAGQIIAPPTYWSGANGKRYAVDVVYQTGTTGVLNGGATTCTGTSGAAVLTCNSANSLSPGQRVSIGTDTNKNIQYVDATRPSAVLVNLTSNLGSNYSTATSLSFSAPVLGPEIQLHTKSSTAPTTLAWLQGDLEENSSAAANGVAAWVNVAAGTPGTWAGIPLGNSSGQLSLSQVAGTSSTSPVCPNGSGGALTTTGCAIGSFSGNTTTFANNAANSDYLIVEPGSSGNPAIGALEFATSSGTSEFEVRDDATYNFHIRDTGATTASDVFTAYINGQTVINSQGTSSVAVNNSSSAGTGGFVVYEGGANYNTAAFTVTSSGNASAPGNIAASTLTSSVATGTAPLTVTSTTPVANLSIGGTAANLSGTPALPNGVTATTQAAGDNSTKLATTAYVQTTAMNPNAPAWLQYLGTGADGANVTATGSMSGEYWYTNFTVPYGNTVTTSATTNSLVIHATGACVIAGSILSNGAHNGWPSSNYGIGGGGSGGSGGGTAAGAAGIKSYPSVAGGNGNVNGGTAGAASGGNGTSGSAFTNGFQRAMTAANGAGLDGLILTGATGVQGGSSGGAGGGAGSGVTLICGSISGTDGTHTGIIDASGANGVPPTANSTGAGSGGGGGVVILSSRAAVTTWPTITVSGGPGALATVPEALALGGSCTTQPKATLGVTSGALNGTCTVVQAGAGCGTGTGLTWSVVGGGGTLGTGTVNPTWSGGALASCTTTAGTSSGYTATTYTTSGAGGDGGNGWYAEFQNW